MTDDLRGCTAINLLLPFDHNGVKHEQIVLRPVSLETTLLWEEGAIPGLLALMARVTGIPEAALAQIKYPDADTAMAMFLNHLPTQIRNGISEGRVPMRVAAEPREPAPLAPGAVTLDDGTTWAPGDPIEGFPQVEGAYVPPAGNAGLDMDIRDDGHG
jgi:hypothetical protein